MDFRTADESYLRDPGKQALDRMKAEREAARTELREWVAVAKEFGAKTPVELRRLLVRRRTN